MGYDLRAGRVVTVDQKDSVGGGLNGCSDLGEVQVHRFGIAAGRIRAAPLPRFGQTAPKM